MADDHLFTMKFTAGGEDIDELGHVNNAVWVRWMERIAVAHWYAVARPEDSERYFWVISRHEIDYRGNLRIGDSATGSTWVEGPASGARSTRRIDFHDGKGKLLVSARTVWAMLDRQTGRPARVTPEILAPFGMDASGG